MFLTGKIPGLIPWLFDHSSHPAMQKVRSNKDQGRGVARQLLDLKRQELKDGSLRKDVMSFLGSWLAVISFEWSLRYSPQVKSSDSQRQGGRLSDEEIISQVRWASSPGGIPRSPLTVYRTILLAGHETTAKAVGTIPLVMPLSNVLLIDSLADVWILGVGQPP